MHLILLLVIFFGAYFLPSIIGRNKRNANAICLLNIFLGWTVIGWVVALVWAASKDDPAPIAVNLSPALFCQGCGKYSGRWVDVLLFLRAKTRLSYPTRSRKLQKACQHGQLNGWTFGQ